MLPFYSFLPKIHTSHGKGLYGHLGLVSLFFHVQGSCQLELSSSLILGQSNSSIISKLCLTNVCWEQIVLRRAEGSMVPFPSISTFTVWNLIGLQEIKVTKCRDFLKIKYPGIFKSQTCLHQAIGKESFLSQHWLCSFSFGLLHNWLYISLSVSSSWWVVALPCVLTSLPDVRVTLVFQFGFYL